MGNIKTAIIIGLAFLFLVKPVVGEYIAGDSARLISSNNLTAQVSVQKANYIKKQAIRNVLERHNSPMVDAVDAFMAACETYDLNCYLLPSIAGLESTYGKFIWPGSYNPFGWGGGYIMFDSWDKGIDTVAKGLRNNYINKGSVSIETVGKIYSESPTWAQRVRLIQSQFEREEEKIQLNLEANGVEL